MDALNRVGGIGPTTIIFVLLATNAIAQQGSVIREGYGFKANGLSAKTKPLPELWSHRSNFAHRSPRYEQSAVPALRFPFLVDTNGRKCMGFGRLFPIENTGYRQRGQPLRPQNVSTQELRQLGQAMVEQSTDDPGSDSEMPAGYTFLAQFIDHDITFDATSMLNRPIRDEEFENARTVALDLDSVYGRGPEQDPYLYNLPYLRVGKWIGGCGYNARFDLLRSRKGDAPGPRGGAARALIGDPRNDENFIVAQMHGTFIAFHNRLADLLIARRLHRAGSRTCAPHRDCDVRRFAAKLSRTEKQQIFEAARDHVIYYYHRIILEDFLPRLIGEQRLHQILESGRSFFFPNGFEGNGRSKQHPFIPVEFAVGAFRYGHSQVRERYQLRRGVRTTLLEAATGRGGGSPAFQPLQRRHLVDWRYFFPISRNRLRGFNFARRIDPEITPFLHELGRSRVVGRNDVVSLPARNLIRGKTFRLPSGQAIAARILPVLDGRGLLPSGGRQSFAEPEPKDYEMVCVPLAAGPAHATHSAARRNPLVVLHPARGCLVRSRLRLWRTGQRARDFTTPHRHPLRIPLAKD